MRVLVLLLTALGGCSGQLVDSFDACELTAILSPSSAAPGDLVTLLGGPLTEPYDTLVQIDGIVATVEDVERSGGCFDCDLCRSETLSCGGCTDRCVECVETLTFNAPDLAPGAYVLVLTNAYGTTGPIEFSIVGPATTDTGTAPTSGGSGGTSAPPAATGDDAGRG